LSGLIRHGVTLILLAALVPGMETHADESAVPPAAIESYKYKFPYKEIFGKSEHRVGDYAQVVHKVGATTTKGDVDENYKASRKLSIDIVTNDSTTARIDAKLIERGYSEDDATFTDEIVEELLHTDFFVLHETTVLRSAKGTLGTSAAPDVVWEFIAARYSQTGYGRIREPDSVTAVLTHGERKILFLEAEDGLMNAYEDGEWLGSGADREYTFSKYLDPDLKLVVLGGMEAAKISAKFMDSIH
jgi:hypothetical protein